MHTNNPEREAWIERARRVRIEDEITRRGIKLRGKIEREGPCPLCNGDDRFSINTKKQVFNCRGCGKGGDTITFVRHIDGVTFDKACEALTGEPPPPPPDKKANGAKLNGSTGHAHKAEDSEGKKVEVESYPYEDADGAFLFRVVRFHFQKPDGSFV